MQTNTVAHLSLLLRFLATSTRKFLDYRHADEYSTVAHLALLLIYLDTSTRKFLDHIDMQTNTVE